MLFNTKSRKPKNIALSVVIIIAMTLSGCSIFQKSSDKEDKKGTSIFNESQSQHYTRASKQLGANKFDQALETYNEFIIKYPFGDLSERARLERIFILNKLKSTEEASVAVDSFIRQYPLHQNIDYAHYMRGVVLFEKKRTTVIERLAGAVEVNRNKNNFEKSHDAFAELIKKYPNSQYIPDARQRMLHLRNNMAAYEMSVANFYASRNAHVAAIKRGQYIVENYDQAPAVIDALKLIASSYQKMGLEDKAIETQEILEANYANIEGLNAKKKTAKKPFLRLPNLNPFKKTPKKS